MSPPAQTPLRRFAPPALALVGAASLESLDPGTGARALGGGLLLAFWFAAAWRLGTRAARARGGPRSRALLRAGLHVYFLVIVTTAALGLLHVLSLTTLTVAAALAWALSPPASLAEQERPSLGELASNARRDPVVAVLVLAAILVSCLTMAWVFLGPPYRWDDLVYHFTYPVEWAQSGSLATRDILFGNHGAAWFPKTTELWFTWLFLPLGELFHLTGAQAPFLVGLALAAYDVARRLGASRRAALVAAAALMLTPVIQFSMAGGHVDIAFACFFLVAVDALLAMRASPGRAGWLEFMGVVGLLLGTKVQAVPVLVFVLAPLAGVLLWRQRPRRWDRDLLSGLGLGLLIALAGGGWWYVRNFALTGNPFFPLLTEVFGFELFDGAYDRSDLPAGDAGLAWRLFDHGHDRAWALFTLVPYALGVIAALLRPRERTSSAALLAVGTSIALLLILEHLVPFAYARFAIPVIAVLVLALLPAMEAPRLRQVVPILILAAAVVQFSRPTNAGSLLPPGLHAVEWTSGVLLALGLATLAALGVAVQICVRWGSKPRAALFFAVPALCVGAAWAGRETSDPSQRHCAEAVVQIWAPGIYLEDQEPARIAVCGTTASLVLHGLTPKHTVANVPVNAPFGTRFSEQVREARQRRDELRRDRNGIVYYREGADLALWNANLDAFGADFLVCYTHPKWLRREPLLVRDAAGFGRESIWAERDPGRFRRVFAERGCRIYEILRP